MILLLQYTGTESE